MWLQQCALFLSVAWLPATAASTTSGWSVNPAAFPDSMAISAIVVVDGRSQTTGILVAFVGTEVRGVVEAMHDPVGFGPYQGAFLFELLVFGDVRGETLTFLFDAGERQIVLPLTIEWEPNVNLGTALSPLVFEYKSDAPPPSLPPVLPPSSPPSSPPLPPPCNAACLALGKEVSPESAAVAASLISGTVIMLCAACIICRMWRMLMGRLIRERAFRDRHGRVRFAVGPRTSAALLATTRQATYRPSRPSGRVLHISEEGQLQEVQKGTNSSLADALADTISRSPTLWMPEAAQERGGSAHTNEVHVELTCKSGAPAQQDDLSSCAASNKDDVMPA